MRKCVSISIFNIVYLVKTFLSCRRQKIPRSRSTSTCPDSVVTVLSCTKMVVFENYCQHYVSKVVCSCITANLIKMQEKNLQPTCVPRQDVSKVWCYNVDLSGLISISDFRSRQDRQGSRPFQKVTASCS